jgi:hypothetical protein
MVLTLLQQQGLVLNMEKCQFGVSKLDYLGLRVSASCIRLMPGHVYMISDYLRPHTTAQLQTFQGMTNFHCGFFPWAACVLWALTDAVRNGKAVNLEWSAQMIEAFTICKTAIAAVVELAHRASEAENFSGSGCICHACGGSAAAV